MIQLPYKWAGKLKEGFNLLGHITDIRMHKEQLSTAVRYWAGAVAASLVMGFLGVWGHLAAVIEQWAISVVPAEVAAKISITPSTLSTQSIIYIASLFGIAATVRTVLSGRARVVKSIGWYVWRFLVLSVLIGAAWGCASGLAIGGFLSVQSINLSTTIIAKVLRFIFVVLSFFFSLLVFRAAVSGFTFGAAFYLQGKSIRDSYRMGIGLLNVHWPYLLGLVFYFAFFTGLIRNVLVPLFPVGSMLALVASAATYLMWPLYWLLLLEYHKGAARSGRTAPRARRSPRLTSSGGSRTRSTRSSSTRTTTRRAPRKK